MTKLVHKATSVTSYMKKKVNLTLLIYIFSISATFAQSSDLPVISRVLEQYDRYREPLITTRLFKHSDVESLIKKHQSSGLLQNEVIGSSVQGRSINHLTIGKGPVKVLLWSQMHGDEATATMALFDLFNFLSADDNFNSFRALVLDKLELHIVPMLNPDGAQIWTRTNAMKIDINRDAQNLATPEARTLMDLGKRLKPDFGFNLHDQSTYYAAGKNTAKPASISFLAPAFNKAKDMNDTRQRAVQVIATMNNALQTTIPGQVAKYNDTFDARCFGDTFQGMGISTTLIETGGYPGDPDKQILRKVNFHAILTALIAIGSESYANEEGQTYWDLPNNFTNLYDIILRNLSLPVKGKLTKTDLAVRRQQNVAADGLTFNYIGQVTNVATLDSAFAYQDIDAGQLEFREGKIKLMNRKQWEDLQLPEQLQLLREGYLFVKWNDGGAPEGPVKDQLINLVNAASSPVALPSGPANFMLYAADKPVFAVVNGFLVDLSKPASVLPNVMAY